MSTLLKQLHQRPIAYYPIYRNITGSTTGAILLSQLMYWFFKKDKFFKTNEDIMKETMLTDRELRTAKKIIKELPFIIVTKEQIPAKTFYKIDWEIYEMHLKHVLPTSTDESSQLDESNRPNSNGRNVPTITKTTSKTTSNNSLSVSRDRVVRSAPKRGDLQSFKKAFIASYSGETFSTHSIGWQPETLFKLDNNNYIFNTVSQRIVSKDESFKIWNYLYEQSLKV